jgi:hypothetical protein
MIFLWKKKDIKTKVYVSMKKDSDAASIQLPNICFLQIKYAYCHVMLDSTAVGDKEYCENIVIETPHCMKFYLSYMAFFSCM